ncbi:hypothetical protein DXG01_004568 [Tephrocybe rancida]|nr:hypothetical protein DXG01_004568 [Tephrocybe rancida]
MSHNDAQDMPAKKRRRVMDVPDGFEPQKTVNTAKLSIQVPKFMSAFDEQQPPQRKPISKSKFDSRSDFVMSNPSNSVSATIRKPKSHPNLKQLAVPTFPLHTAEKDQTTVHAIRLQPVPDPRALTKGETSSVTTPQLFRRPLPQPPVIPPAPSKPGPTLKNLPAPTIVVPSEKTSDTSLRTISTTEIALATDLFTDSGTAELAHIFLHDQHPEIAASNKQQLPEWNIGMSPQKGGKHAKGGKEGKYIKGGLAARSSELISQFQTSLALWQKETELQLASSSSGRLNPDLRLRIVRIIDLPLGPKPSSPRKPSFATSSATSIGVAVCRVLSTSSQHPYLLDVIPRIREKQYHLVVLSFPTVAPPRLRGRNGIYIRNPEDFIVGRDVLVWQPCNEVSFSPQTPSEASTDDPMYIDTDRPTVAPFPTLPSTYPRPPSQQTEEDSPTTDTVLLCSRFVIMP